VRASGRRGETMAKGSLWRILSETYVVIKGLLRYKGTLFWVIVFPILFYSLMIGIWGNSGPQRVDLGIVVEDKGVRLENGSEVNMSNVLINVLNSTKVYNIHHVDNESALIGELRDGKISVGLLIPKNFTISIISMNKAKIKIITLHTQWSDYYVGPLYGIIEGFSDKVRDRFINISLQYIPQYVPPDMQETVQRYYRFIEEPVNVTVEEHTPTLLQTPGGVKAYYAIGMIGVEILFIGLSMGVTAVIDMKREGTLKVVVSSPMRSWELFLSLTAAALLSVAISAVAIILYSLPLGAEYRINLTAMLVLTLILAIAALFSIGFGLLLAPLARTQEAAMAIVNSVAFPIMFIGGIVVPPFILPKPLQQFAAQYPLSRLIEATRQMLIYEKSASWALSYSLLAVIGTLVLFVIGFAIFSKLLARAVEE
jgi:ABC-2 type transport system permease protein